MSKPATITQWLQSPAAFSVNDRKAAAAIIKEHPYFVPTRYVEAAAYHNKESFSPSMMSMMQLYKGNWLYFYNFLQSAVTGSGQAAAGDTDVPGTGWNNTLSEEDENIFADTSYEEEQDEALEEEGAAGQFAIWEDETEALLSNSETTGISLQQEKSEMPPDYGFDAIDEAAVAPVIPVMPETGDIIEEVVQEDITIATEIGEDYMIATPANKAPEAIVVPQQEQPPSTPEAKTATTDIPGKKNPLIQPIYTEDYFLYQGIQTPQHTAETGIQKPEEKSLMVVMSFSEWLIHFKTKGEREKEEVEDQKALKTMWQKEKLASALEEENEEIPENVFEMAVNSITREEDLASESLAEIMVKQGKYDKAIEMYRKLSLRNPQKNAYFARKIESINKEKLS